MGQFEIDTDSEPGVLKFTLDGGFSVDEFAAFLREHNRAVDDYRGSEYVVFGDLRRLKPLSPECTDIFEQAKRHSAAQPNFRGSAILVGSNVIALQHRRTSITGGVMDRELISESAIACRNHLDALRRSSR